MTPRPDPVASLISGAGPREAVPAECARRVEAAVRLEWQDVVQKRAGHRRAAWIAASCLASAALIALVLHAHVGVAPDATVASSRTGPQYVTRVTRTLGSTSGAYFRMDNEDRPPDRGVPRHVLASYSGPER